MSVIIAKQCVDGVFMVADSVCRHSDGHTAPDGIKYDSDTFHGEPYAMVFAGHAGIVGGNSTLDYIKIVPGLPGSLQDAMESALRSYCIYAEANPPTQEEIDAIPPHLRAEFTDSPKVVAYYSVRWFEWWVATVLAAPGLQFRDHQHTHTMRGLWPTNDEAIKAELNGLCTLAPTTIAEAAPLFAAAFDRAHQRLPDNCQYPGRLLLHRANGVTYAPFNNSAELLALAGA